MVLYADDLLWLKEHSVKQDDGTWRCLYTGRTIEFIKTAINISLPLGIKQPIKVSRPYCPGCSTAKEIKKPGQKVSNKDIVLAVKKP